MDRAQTLAGTQMHHPYPMQTQFFLMALHVFREGAAATRDLAYVQYGVVRWLTSVCSLPAPH